MVFFFFLFLIFKYYFVCLLRAVERLPWSVCSMEAKSLFSLHRALAQPVKMCMFDFPVSILDDLPLSRRQQHRLCGKKLKYKQ
ncbi:hypothetical protein F7725_013267 [Dissostichus mawsoni]|uniref:Uncharacterized protein n=1 Tax=Dissostichus mawsoni TaxID=36200 RepID=A0A7J5YPY8_DISMA|nr:hypothetical protein F7725_013267 [Dissostichus mawsoni]